MMYRSWDVIEPDERDESPERGAQGLLGDPLFLLARQWRFGELDGFDGGAPIAAFVDYQHLPPTDARVDGRALGSVSVRPVGAWYAEPLERLLDPARADAERLTLALGRRLERLVDDVARREPPARIAWDELVQALPERDPTTEGPMMRLAHRDGRRPLRGVDAIGALLDPARPRFAVAALERALETFLGAFSPPRAARPVPDPFDSDRLEHALEVRHERADDIGSEGMAELSLRANGAEPRWWHVTSRTPPGARPDRRERVVPTRLTFPGMPPQRFWQRMDADVDWQSVEAEPSELPRLIGGIVMVQGGANAYVLPLSVPRGGLLCLSRVECVDAFGESTAHVPSDDGPDLWHARGENDLAVLIDLEDGAALRGEPLESVALVPDPVGGRAWLIERTRLGARGRGIDVNESVRSPEPPDPGAPPYVDLRRPPPANWMPLLPDEAGALIARPLDDPDVPTVLEGELGRAITALVATRLPTDGLALRRRWCAGRTRDGRLSFWIERDRADHDERRASGLAFDRLVLAADRP